MEQSKFKSGYKNKRITRTIPSKKLSWGMNTLDIVCIKPKTTHSWKWSFSNYVKKFCIDNHNSSCSSIICLPPINRCYVILFQCEILQHREYMVGSASRKKKVKKLAKQFATVDKWEKSLEKSQCQLNLQPRYPNPKGRKALGHFFSFAPSSCVAKVNVKHSFFQRVSKVVELFQSLHIIIL